MADPDEPTAKNGETPERVASESAKPPKTSEDAEARESRAGAAAKPPTESDSPSWEQPAGSEDEAPAKRLERRLKQRAGQTVALKKEPKVSKRKSSTGRAPSVDFSDGARPSASRRASGAATPTASVSVSASTPIPSTTSTPTPTALAAAPPPPPPGPALNVDEFGLPIRPAEVIQYTVEQSEEEKEKSKSKIWSFRRRSTSRSDATQSGASSRASSMSRRWSLRGSFDKDAETAEASSKITETVLTVGHDADTIEEEPRTPMPPKKKDGEADKATGKEEEKEQEQEKKKGKDGAHRQSMASTTSTATTTTDADEKAEKRYTKDFATEHANATTHAGASHSMSEFSHQKLVTEKEEPESNEDDGWQTMPAFAPYDIYDDDNRLVAREHVETEEESYGYAGLGGAGKGYTRVLVDDDAESATSMDDNTQYLFKQTAGTSMMEEEEEQRDAVSQMQATKDLLTEGQRIAYVGITRLHLSSMVKVIERAQAASSKKMRKEIQIAAESMRMWSQKMMIRLYAHMEISLAEQVMIEQLSEHGVEPKDLTSALMANSRVANPMADGEDGKDGKDGQGRKRPGSVSSPRAPQTPRTPHTPQTLQTPHTPQTAQTSHVPLSPSTPLSLGSTNTDSPFTPARDVDELEEAAEPPPPPYDEHRGEELPAVRTPSQLPTTDKIDIDLRWTVLCDLFLVLIADSVYDSRSRVLLELVGESLDVPWMDICKFEKKVTEALEMQQNAEKENWDEKDHMETRRKMALKRRYVMMGLATVGGGLVIGLSAGLLAPVIGAGLAAGFTTIGVTGTSSFLAGAGGAAIITSSAAASGSVIGGRAAGRRTGAVKTFEYRPLHNNKRVNLIVTVSGWMTGKVDDVRLPFSTVDPVMGDIYSVLWEPEMLTSMGDTINILATEALTQGLQQVLGSTILVSLMAALQLPVVLTKLSYLIDNPWAVSLDRATMAGLILADSLVDRNLGTRPVTLVGYSLGSRVIFSCLMELARKGAYGLVQNVFMFGSPVVVKQDEYQRARSVVAGRLVNGYNRNDWILGYLFRLTNGGIRRVAGLGRIEDVEGIENMDVTEFVVGHMDYRTAMPRLLRECGWLVESDEFTEIEDPDPENHGERQRELINEIEEARKELERESKAKKSGGAFRFFSRKKKGEKQEWEIYEEAAAAKRKAESKGEHGRSDGEGGEGPGGPGLDSGVLFDVDAIRAELAKERQSGRDEDELQLEQLQVRELESTLPPMKLDMTPTPSPSLPFPTTAKSPLRSPYSPYLNSPRLSSSSSSVDRRPSGDRTPTGGGLGGGLGLGYYGGMAQSHDDSNGISMTFDTAFDDRSTRLAEQTPLPRSPAVVPPNSFSPTVARSTGSLGATAAGTLGAVGLGAVGATAAAGAAGTTSTWTAGTAATGAETGASPPVPAITLSDPWGEYEDEDFGKEKEISMTFA